MADAERTCEACGEELRYVKNVGWCHRKDGEWRLCPVLAEKAPA